MVSPQYPSLPAFSSVANGYGPCRSCLGTFDEGNDYRTSFTYDPVEGILDLSQPGPVFIHSAKCERYAGNAFPEGLRGIPMYFEAFDSIGSLLHRVRAEIGTEGSQINSLFADENVEFLHIRNAEAGCFIARVEKGEFTVTKATSKFRKGFCQSETFSVFSAYQQIHSSSKLS